MTNIDHDADSSERGGEFESFRELVAAVGVGVGVYGGDGRFIYVNEAYAEILDADRETLEGTPVWEINPEFDRERFEGYWESFDEGDTQTSEAVHATGEREVPVESVTTCVEIDGTRYHVGTIQEITERKEQERQISDLHDATREMVLATDEDEICEIAVEAAETTLKFSITGLWIAAEGGDRLVPAVATETATELFGTLPEYAEGNSLSWQAYASGSPLVFDDLREHPGLYNPDTQIRSELIVPLGAYGVMNMGSVAPGAFTENDIVLAKLLAANVQVALGRAERERHLERQTDQMEFFNSILRHDVLNAVTVIKSRGEFLAEDLQGEQLRDAETIIGWSEDVKEIVQQVRTVLETLTGSGDPHLEAVDLGSELRREVERIRSTYPTVSFDAAIPDTVSVRANDLLGDVLGNIVTNAIDHNDADGLHVSITVRETDEWVVVRIADNGRGVSDDRKEAIFRRDETGHAKASGSGFGLFFVDVMVAEYGGDVWVEDNDAGGATFVVRLPATE